MGNGESVSTARVNPRALNTCVTNRNYELLVGKNPCRPGDPNCVSMALYADAQCTQSKKEALVFPVNFCDGSCTFEDGLCVNEGLDENKNG